MKGEKNGVRMMVRKASARMRGWILPLAAAVSVALAGCRAAPAEDKEGRAAEGRSAVAGFAGEWAGRYPVE